VLGGVVVGVAPAERVGGLAGKLQDVVPAQAGHAKSVEQIHDLAEVGANAGGLQPPHLAFRPAELPGQLVGVDLGLPAQVTELGTETAAPTDRVGTKSHRVPHRGSLRRKIT